MEDEPRHPTEQLLIYRRLGTTQAERLCAGLLVIDGFENVDPQSPLGGPDGLKDVLCQKASIRYIAAVYFPNSDKPFNEIKKKFEDDCPKSATADREGFVFLTNQRIAPGEREALISFGARNGLIVEIYHSERIRLLLDSPRGYGLRLEFLRVSMTLEEQLAFWGEWKDDLAELVRRQSTDFIALRDRVDAYIAERLTGLTDVREELAFIFAVLCYGIPTIVDSLPAQHAIKTFFKSSRDQFALHLPRYKQYVKMDTGITDTQREIALRSADGWDSANAAACKLFLGDAADEPNGMTACVENLMKSLDPRAPDFAELFKGGVLQTFERHFADIKRPLVKLKVFVEAISQVNALFQQHNSENPNNQLAPIEELAFRDNSPSSPAEGPNKH